KVFPMGIMAAGNYQVSIQEQVLDGPHQGTYALALGWQVLSCDTTVKPPGLPFVEHVVIGWPASTAPPEGRICPNDSFPVSLSGYLPAGCWGLERVELVPIECFAAPCLPPVRVVMRNSGSPACPDVLMPWSGQVMYPGLPIGNYNLTVVVEAASPDTGLARRYSGSGQFPFQVPTRCDSVVPAPGPLPYVDRIVIGPPDPTGGGCIAAGESISVAVTGTFPNDCFRLKRIDVIPSPRATPLPWPPTVRLVVDDGGCLGRPCRNTPVTWTGRAMLPGLPARSYELPVQLARVSCTDTILPGNLFSTTVPFVVSDSCPGLSCLMGGWVHPNVTDACDAHAAPGRSVQAPFTAASPVALSGLQGAFNLSPAGMFVQDVEAIGPAAGMHLTWKRTATGASFVMYAEHGAPIPATPGGSAPPAILRVTLYPDTDLVGLVGRTPVMYLMAAQLLGSDAGGGGVPACQFIIEPFSPIPAFRICLDQPCDFNGDGVADVRDLVLMVHCVNGDGPCPAAQDSSGATHDCNHDGAFTLDDVICCATSILLQGGCTGCYPDSAGARPAPEVKLAMDAPVATAAGADVGLHLSGAPQLGAVRLALSYPVDRYDVASVEFTGLARDWLHLYQVADGTVRIGLIFTAPGHAAKPGAAGQLDLVLHLALKPGQQPGGQLSVAEGQFSGPDGAALQVNLGSASLPLGAPARLALSANRPNPFSAGTRFSVELDRAGDVDVGVFDISGRRVTTLFRGALPAGSRDFSWDGRRADGSPAPSGIYFSRVVSQGRAVSRKMLLVRGS
ncbi:MAG TPA: FlgD immunoglobulin-like domain containing protein, partial [Candidatus Saccharimonadales bacterium]|nr:FlgD immunoglobulin-like domain containing protein [Candidatus Saccharimonadales bacterium]